MAHSSLIQVRVDEELKQDAEQLFKDIGMDVPSAIRLFLKQSIIHNGIPFVVAGKDGFFNEFNMRILKESIQQLDQGAGIAKTTEELEAMSNG